MFCYLGLKERGLRQKTLGYSDHKFKISINPKIESLNISNTVSIVCHFIQSQLHSKIEIIQRKDHFQCLSPRLVS